MKFTETMRCGSAVSVWAAWQRSISSPLGFVLAGGGLASLVFGLDNLGRRVMLGYEIGVFICIGGLLLASYVLHSRLTAHPLIDLSLLREPLFRNATIGTVLTRMAAGASPFLLALMLQLGLGFTPLMAGLLTVAEAVGALRVIRIVQPLFHLYGYRGLLTSATALASVSLLSYAMIRPATPIWLILALLFCGGMTRSVLVTSLNAVAFLRVDASDISRASSLFTVCQQVAASLGIGLTAALLGRLSMGATFDHRIADTIPPIFVALTLSSAAALFFIRNVPRQSDLAAKNTIAVSEREDRSSTGFSLDI